MDIEIISANALKSIINNRMELRKYQIIDLRTKQEYNEFHLYSAINIEYDRFMEINNYNAFLNKNKIIILYCDRGGRSIYAVNRLAKYGYTVKSLSGGINDYLKY